MKLQTSNKTASFGKKPYVKKGYYPGRLLKVDTYSDKDGKLIEGKYGHQLILDFAVYAKDENDTPTEPLMFQEEGKEPVAVVVPKFVYYEYPDKENPGKFQTAITPNSAITKLLVSLGWTFSEEDVDVESFVGSWADLNLTDFETKDKEKNVYTASSVSDVGKYTGKEIPADLDSKKVESKPEVAPEKECEENMPKEEDMKKSEVTEEDPEKLEAKIKELDKLRDDGHLTEDGHKSATEQINAKLDSLKK